MKRNYNLPASAQPVMLMDFSGLGCTLAEAFSSAAAYLRDAGVEDSVIGGWIELDNAQGWSVHLAFGRRVSDA